MCEEQLIAFKQARSNLITHSSMKLTLCGDCSALLLGSSALSKISRLLVRMTTALSHRSQLPGRTLALDLPLTTFDQTC